MTFVEEERYALNKTKVDQKSHKIILPGQFHHSQVMLGFWFIKIEFFFFFFFSISGGPLLKIKT